MKYDARYDLQQFVQPRLQVSPMFGQMRPEMGQRFFNGLGQNTGPGTFGREYFGLERYLGGLGQSSVDDGYADEADYEEGLYGFGALEDEKSSAAQMASSEIERVRTQLREAGRGDLVEAVNSTATLFQTRLAAARTEGEIVELGSWLSTKLLGLLAQAQNGGQAPTAPPSSGGGGGAPPPVEPVVGAGTSNTALLVLGGIALAAAGIYVLRMQG
jgi:hypothetical protein